jgi:ElaB/YqjD/DUF883 family membrane-anchored ribosome-binding protein
MNTQERNQQPVLDRPITRAGQYVRETAGQVGETAARASEGLEQSVDNIQLKFNDLRDSVIDKTKEYSRTANSYVSKNPWAAIGISAGVAFLVGMFVGRKRSD